MISSRVILVEKMQEYKGARLERRAEGWTLQAGEKTFGVTNKAATGAERVGLIVKTDSGYVLK